MRATLQPGLTATLTYQVPCERTVPYLLPESDGFAAMPEVLATGYLVGLVEWTCMRVIGDHLEPAEQSLGIHVDLSHDAPTPPGSTLTVQAELTSVERRRLTFAVHAFDELATVCEGSHRRAVIDTTQFYERLSERIQSGEAGRRCRR